MNQATVEFRHVSKDYGSHGAVVDLSLLVPAGEICVLVGPSGCGKTTSLKMVNRLVEPTRGQVLIDGQDVMQVEVTALRRRIGYVIQQTGLFPHQTIAENVATVPRLLGWPRARMRARVEELLELVGLDPGRVRNRYPAQLSGGERQRVGVARAMAAEPPVMLMDEPFGAVDPIVRERLQNEFLRLHRTLGTTVLFVTHDIDEAIKMGDRVAVMQQGGHLAQYAPPADLLLNPTSDFVARFVGGVDRRLKVLALLRVADAPVQRAPSVTLADGEHVLRVDTEGRPVGWVRGEGSDHSVASRDAIEVAPVLVRHETTLRDALSLVLASPVHAAVVVDDQGRFAGVLKLDAIGSVFQSSGEHETAGVA